MLLKKFIDWTKLKFNMLAALANFHRLGQGGLSLAEYTDKATILCDQCEYPPAAHNRLLQDAIVIGLCSIEANDKCIERGWALTLVEEITIAHSQDATASRVGYISCEVDIGASSKILPLCKAKTLFRVEVRLAKPTVNLKGYNDSPVQNLGSCIWTCPLRHFQACEGQVPSLISQPTCFILDSSGWSFEEMTSLWPNF